MRLFPITVTWTFLVCLLPTRCDSAATLSEFIDLTYTTLVSAADHADVVAWVSRRRGEEQIIVAHGPNYQPRKVTELVSDIGDTIRSITFSPDGRWLVFRRGPMPAPNGRMPNPASLLVPLVDGLWLVDLKQRTAPVMIAAGGGSAIFSPQSDRLAFSKAGSLRVIDPEQRQSVDPLFVDNGNVTQYAWSPDGKAIAFVSSRRTSSFVGLYQFETDRIRWLTSSAGKDSNIAWSPDGSRIAFLRRPGSDYSEPFQVMQGDPFEIWSLDVASGEAKLLHQDKQRNLFKQLGFPLRWLADGRVLFLSDADGFSHLYAVAQDSAKPMQLTSGDFEVETAIVNRTGSTVAIASNRSDVNRRDVATWEIGQPSFQQISAKDTVATEPVFLGNTGKIVYLSADHQRSPTPAVVSADGKGREKALVKSPVMAMYQKPETVSFQAADGLQINGTLFRAQGLPPGKGGSAVVYVHGGPPRQMMPAVHRSLYYAYAYATNQYLAARGMTVLAVNYRCGIGFGRDFHSVPNYGPHGAAEFQDVVAAGEYLRQLPAVDPARIGIYGGSYGGFLTAYGLGRRSDLFAAGVAWHGIYDWSYWRSNPLPGGMFFTPWGVAQEDPKIVRDSSPIAHVNTWQSPVLLISGDDDRRVLVEETVVLEQALNKSGVSVETMILPNEIHGFLRHQSWQSVLEQTANFLLDQLTDESG
jgi:dipeptidyl aminopeptidase/acylaminoacyl peptidase